MINPTLIFFIVYCIGFSFCYALLLAKKREIYTENHLETFPVEIPFVFYSLVWVITIMIYIFYKWITKEPEQPKQPEQKPIEEHLVN